MLDYLAGGLTSAYGMVPKKESPPGSLFGTASYPLHAFPAIAQNAALELRKNYGAPYDVIGACLLGAMAGTCQSRIRVQVFGELHKISVYILAVSVTGSAKTPTFRRVFRPLLDYEKACQIAYKTSVLKYKTDFDYWMSINNGILKQIKDVAKKADSDEELSDLRRKLQNHAAKTPSKPRDLSFIKKNISGAGLVKALEGDDQSVLLATEEGDEALDDGVMSEHALLSSAWEGETLSYERLNRKIVALEPNVTICLLTQPHSWLDYFKKSGKRAVALGLLPRFLTSISSETQSDETTPIKDQTWDNVAVLHHRMNDLINACHALLRDGRSDPIVIQFDDEAEAMFDRMMTGKNKEMRQTDGPLDEVKEFLSKAPMNIARVAAIFHHFSGKSGKITTETLLNAAHLIDWYLNHARIIFEKEQNIPQAERDAAALEAYLHRAIYFEGNHVDGLITPNRSFVMKNYVLQYCTPTYLRKANRLNGALDVLCAQDRIRVGPIGDTIYIQLNQEYFASLPLPRSRLRRGT